MNISLLRNTNKLELHYFLRDNSHSMNAFARNKCEQELLAIFKEAARILDINIEIESEAFHEGGVREFWDFLGKNSPQLTLLVIIITAILSRFPVSDGHFNELRETELSLSIEEKKLNIEKLKNEIKEIGKDNKSEDRCVSADEVVEIINDNLKIRKHKSNFYNNLLNYRKVIKISTNCLDADYQKILKDQIVERKDFYKFILKTDNLAPEIDEEAIIEIISPVLKKGNFKWKGIYNEEVISFYMKDGEFKNQVIQSGMKFMTGTFMECVVEKTRKIDSLGEIVISGYSVTTVIRKYDNSESIETPQGKRYERYKKNKSNQMGLFKPHGKK